MEENTVKYGAGACGTRMVAVALNGGSKSRNVLRWATEKFVPGSKVTFKLLHVYPKITGVPTPMGNLIPFAQVREDVAVAYKKEIEWQKTEVLSPFQKLLSLQKIAAEIVLIESDDIANGISAEIAKHGIEDLVIGASTKNMFARRIKGQLLSGIISQRAPSLSTVYVVSKGKLECIRPADFERNASFKAYDSSDCFSAESSSRYTNSTFDPGSTAPGSPLGSLFPQTKGLNTFLDPRREIPEFTGFDSAQTWSLDYAMSPGTGSVTSCASTYRTAKSDGDQPSNPISHLVSSSQGQMDIIIELEKLTSELRHIRGMYAIAQNETIDTSRRLSDLSLVREEEAIKLREISEKEEKSRVLAKLQNEKFEGAKREAEYARICTEREAVQRREAEQDATHNGKEKEKLLEEQSYQYQKFTWEEITFATSNFNKELKIGEGSYGTVYKCILHHTRAAVKVLRSKEGANNKQFHKELEILSKIRHPHLLLLLGACPEQGCLVYEYMENGSLEDRLLRKDNTPPIPWYVRFRIAWEVASSLAFLHNNKPKPIIHRDLKPANILLDHNFVSKIGDVGLCKTLYSTDTNPVGTLCYIDPEYQRTGQISVKSDVYALGMVILQLLTAKPAVGIAHVVEDAIEERRLMDVLDKDGGRWPIRETIEMAMLGVQCAELRGRDRPDLNSKIIPTLERMKNIAEKAREMAASIRMAPPNHFLCPILEAVMDDPCVASDGYTYDRRAIELWMKDNDTSPTTNFPLSNKSLIPNYNLRYAIVEWKSKTRNRQQ